MASSCQVDQKVRYHEKPSKVHSQQKSKPSFSTPCPDRQASQNYPLISLDYLLFRAENTGLVYAYEKVVILTPGTFSNRSLQGRMVNPNRTWRPGFRIGVGWHTFYDDWSIQAEWTYYYNKSVTNRAAPNIALSNLNQNQGEGFYPYWATPIDDLDNAFNAYYQNLRGVWQLNYNMINLEFGKPFQILEKLCMRPHFGLQNGWIHQRMSILYLRSFQDSIPLSQIIKDQQSDLTNHFWGIGFRSGIDTSWSLGGGWDVLGKFAGSLLTGRTASRTIQSTDFQKGGNFLRMQNNSSKNSHIVPGIQASLGLSWGTSFFKKVEYFSLSALWEMNYWWAQFGGFLKPAGPSIPLTGAENYITGIYESYPFTDGSLVIGGITVRGEFSF